MKLVGRVRKVIFSSPTFSVLLVAAGLENVVVTSPVPLEVGEEAEFKGEFVTHERFGLQFKAEEVKPLSGIEASLLKVKGVSTATWKKLKQAYGWRLSSILKGDPYRIAFELKGFGFKKIDAIASELGVNKRARDEAATKWVLTSFFENGHTCMPQKEFEEEIKKLSAEVAEDLIKTVDGFVTTKEMYETERKLARLLLSFKYTNGWWNSESFLVKLKEFVHQQQFPFSSDQLGAFSCLSYPVSILTGGPGTGKTTLLKFFVKFLKENNLNVVIAAPTGKAARRLEEVTGARAYTIHKLLLQLTPQATDVLIVDETSMLSSELALKLLESLKKPSQIIFVGDPDQLPSIDPGNVLEDLIKSEVFPHWHLSSAHRFKNDSITQAAECVLSGKWPRGIKFIQLEPDQLPAVLNTITSEWQVLSPMRRGKTGTSRINSLLQKRFTNATYSFGNTKFGIGDRVIWTKNDYKLMLLNGQIGKVVNVKPLVVKFEDLEEPVKIPEDKLFMLELAWAISVHKAQGSQFKKVLIPIFTEHYIMLSKRLIYTAITRAEEECVFVGQKKALMMGINRKDQHKRYTLLKKFLKEFDKPFNFLSAK